MITRARATLRSPCRGPCLQLQRLVRLNPDLLLYDVRKSLAPRVAALQQLFPESPKLLMRAPSLLYHDTETYLLPKMRQLEGLLPGVDILRLVRSGRFLLATLIYLIFYLIGFSHELMSKSSPRSQGINGKTPSRRKRYKVL